MYTTCTWWYSPGTTIIKVDVYYMYLMVFSGTTIIKVDVYVHVPDGILRYYYY